MTSVCEMPFIVAASGSQPTGDAIATCGRSCIQAKRYRRTTALNLNDIAGNIYTALRSVPSLEVYVLVVTRDTAQLRQHVFEVETRTGLDVVILEAGEKISPLGSLLVTHWMAVRTHFPKLSPAWDNWAAKAAAEPAIRSQVSAAVAALREGLRTQSWLQDASRQRLATRFAPSSSTTAFDAQQRINLGHAVARPGILGRIGEWWTQSKEPNCAVEADEGFGKTWIAAAFALQTAERNTVLWLESNQWSGCDSIEALIRSALKSILPEGDERIASFSRKALRLWRKPILLVLDGVNEHRCFEAAQKLLQHYSDHRDHFAQRVRILFTTRPLEFRPAWDKTLWRICRTIPIESFDDKELTAALELHAPGLKLAEMPTGLLTLARVPRYFHLAIRLRERLRGIGEITKPLLLFTDLLAKVEVSAPAFRQLYATGNLRDAEQILAFLASSARTHLPTGWELSREHVKQCFPHLDPTLVELAEGRVLVERRPGSVVVNDQHVALGFALHLLHVGEQSSNTDSKALADEIARVLEPNREQDSRTEALYLALLLTCLRPTLEPATLERLRSALLALWWNSHNANHDQTRLDFWAREDTAAYLRAIEAVFFRHFSAPTEESLVAPIARLWRENGISAAAMAPVLERWLALIFPAVFEDDSPSDAAERARFPFVSASELLRLSAVALSILSQRPDLTMLPALARCARSRHFCISKIYHDKKSHPFRLKDIGEVISILLRWGYGERVISDLEILAREANDEGTLDGYQSLAIQTSLAKLPEILTRKPKEPPFNFRWPDTSPQALRTGLSDWIAHLPASHDHWPRINHLGRLAVFSELPDLDATESTSLADYLDGLGQKRALLPNMAREDIEGYKDLLPWLARAQPTSLGKIHASCWSHYLASDSPDPISWEPLVPLPSDRIEALLAVITSSAEVAEKVRRADCFSTHFTTTVLISGDEHTWLKWFEHLQRYPGGKYEAWEIIPAPFVLARVATPSFRTELRNRYERALGVGDLNAAPKRDAVFWLHVLATTIDVDVRPSDLSLARWAATELRVIDSKDERTGYFLRILACCRDAELLESVLTDETLKRHLTTPTLARTFGFSLHQPTDRKLKLTYRDVAGQMPLNLARGFLLMASTEDDLLDYARAVGKAALTRVSQPSGRPPFGFVSQFAVDETGNIEGWGLERGSTANSYAQHNGGTALWGVDRGSLADFGKRIANHGKPDEGIESFNIELSRQNERIDNLPDAFVVLFHGSHALETWARLCPEEYLSFVRMLSDKLRQDHAHLFDLGAFTYALLRPLCRIDLDLAVRLHDEFFTRDVVRVVVMGEIPAFVADLWHHSLNDIVGIEKARKQTLVDCRNDLHVLWITLSSIIGDTLGYLETMTNQFVLSEWGKDRALAVTVMAFTGEKPWLDVLERLQTDDPSLWVRQQAKWSQAVLQEALAARAIWNNICAQPIKGGIDLIHLSAQLVQLGPALPMAARWWPRPEWEKQDTAAGALLLAFLGEWKNTGPSRGEAEIGNRKIKGFFCGAELSGDHATRMAPWWTP